MRPRCAFDSQPAKTVDRRDILIIKLYEGSGDRILYSPAKPRCSNRNQPVTGIILAFDSAPKSVDHIIERNRRKIPAEHFLTDLKAIRLVSDLNVISISVRNRGGKKPVVDQTDAHARPVGILKRAAVLSVAVVDDVASIRRLIGSAHGISGAHVGACAEMK